MTHAKRTLPVQPFPPLEPALTAASASPSESPCTPQGPTCPAASAEQSAKTSREIHVQGAGNGGLSARTGPVYMGISDSDYTYLAEPQVAVREVVITLRARVYTTGLDGERHFVTMMVSPSTSRSPVP